MDDIQHPAEANGLPQGPHFHTGEPAGFAPLRLILQPSGMSLELNRPDMLLGRHSEADIRLPLPDVSRKHCRFQFAGGQWGVVDLNSLNGVFVNDQQVLQTVLRHGDRLRIGGFTFLVDLGVAPHPERNKEFDNLAQTLFKGRGSSIEQFLSPNNRQAS